MVLDKALIHEVCILKVKTRIEEIVLGMQLANESLISDTKSSMGDKYETSREMAQQDLTRLQNQLNQAESDLKSLLNLSTDIAEKIRIGSLVFTNEQIYYLAVSIGPIEVNKNRIMVISSKSPLGLELLGKRIGDKFYFQSRSIEILTIS